MRRKKLLTVFLTVVFSVAMLAPVYADSPTALEKVNEIERILYGAEQQGALLDRVNSLEVDVYGSAEVDALLTRIDRVYRYVKGSSGSTEPSFLTKINMIEWSFAEKLSEGPAKTRLEDVEKLLHGRTDEGALDDRIDVLMAMAFKEGAVEMQRVVLPKDFLIKVGIAQDLHSKTTKVGDDVLFRAEDNVYVGNVLAIPKGAVAHGKITKVSPARNFGRNGAIEIEYTGIKAVDSSNVPITLGKLAKEATESMALAAGASMAGMIILGPVGAIGGVFVKGKEYSIPAGAVLYVQTKEDCPLNGVYMPEAQQGSQVQEPVHPGSGGL